MSSEVKRPTQGLDTSLDFEKEFTYINLVPQEDPRRPRRSRLNLLSKASASPTKPPSLPKKRKPLLATSRSLDRKKSKTTEKSLSKKHPHDRKNNTKNPSLPKRPPPTLEPKPPHHKTKSLKVLKPVPSKRLLEECKDPRKVDQSSKRRKPKEKEEAAAVRAEQTREKTVKREKHPSAGRQKQAKGSRGQTSQQGTDSQIHRSPKVGSKEEKVMHEYFAMSDKLSSIVEEKKQHKRDKSKLSKCKTHSSSSSLTSKGNHFSKKSFLPKPKK